MQIINVRTRGGKQMFVCILPVVLALSTRFTLTLLGQKNLLFCHSSIPSSSLRCCAKHSTSETIAHERVRSVCVHLPVVNVLSLVLTLLTYLGQKSLLF